MQISSTGLSRRKEKRHSTLQSGSTLAEVDISNITKTTPTVNVRLMVYFFLLNFLKYDFSMEMWIKVIKQKTCIRHWPGWIDKSLSCTTDHSHSPLKLAQPESSRSSSGTSIWLTILFGKETWKIVPLYTGKFISLNVLVKYPKAYFLCLLYYVTHETLKL